MSIVGGYCCSHTGLIITRRQLTAPDVAERVYAAYAAVREEIATIDPDAIVIVATDHLRAFSLRSIVQVSIGASASASGFGDAGIEPAVVPLNQDLARAVLSGFLSRGIDLSFSEESGLDHSFMMPLSLITPNFDVPIVPVTINCNVPPRMTLARSRDIGVALGEVLREEASVRAVVIGTGGLSHWVGSDERRAFMNGPVGSRIADIDRHPVEIGDTGPINSDFDEAFLAAVSAGKLEAFLEGWEPERLEREAGNGAQEVRNWLLAVAALGHPSGEVLCYEAVSEWLTGIAVVRFTTN